MDLFVCPHQTSFSIAGKSFLAVGHRVQTLSPGYFLSFPFHGFFVGVDTMDRFPMTLPQPEAWGFGFQLAIEYFFPYCGRQP